MFVDVKLKHHTPGEMVGAAVGSFPQPDNVPFFCAPGPPNLPLLAHDIESNGEGVD